MDNQDIPAALLILPHINDYHFQQVCCLNRLRISGIVQKYSVFFTAQSLFSFIGGKLQITLRHQKHEAIVWTGFQHLLHGFWLFIIDQIPISLLLVQFRKQSGKSITFSGM